jgi:hypothetical protein
MASGTDLTADVVLWLIRKRIPRETRQGKPDGNNDREAAA